MLRTLSRRATLVVALALLGTALGLARAEDPKGSYFPLEVGRQWRYHLSLTVEHANQASVCVRTIARQVSFKGREAYLVEDRIGADNQLVSTETIAKEGDKIYVLATKQEGSVERVSDPPRLFLDLAQLETVGAVWSWTSVDGRETFEAQVVESGPFVDQKSKIQRGSQVVITGTLKSADGKRSAKQERRLWLVRGTGLFREHAVYTPPGEAGEHATTTDMELEPKNGPDGAGK